MNYVHTSVRTCITLLAIHIVEAYFLKALQFLYTINFDTLHAAPYSLHPPA